MLKISQLFWIVATVLVGNTAYALVPVFLPVVFSTKGIQGMWTGLIFGVYAIAVIFVSPLISQMIKKSGHVHLISFGVWLMGTVFMVYSTLVWISDPWVLVISSIILRFLQGTSSACIQTSIYSIATNDYPENQQLIVGLVELATGLGLIFGPILGSFIAQTFSYQATFCLQGLLLWIYAIIVLFRFPEHSRSQLHEHLLDDTQPPESRPVSILALLKIPRFTLAALAGSLSFFTYSFMEPILAIRLIDFDLTLIQTGLFFAVLPCFYIPACVMIQYIPTKIEKRVVIISSMAFLFAAFLLVGPSRVFRMPDWISLMVIGQAIVGLLSPMMLIPILPEMVEAATIIYPRHKETINDLSAGIFNAFLGFGQFCAPTFGALMFNQFGFRTTCDTVAFICLSFAAIYLVKGKGIESFKNSLIEDQDETQAIIEEIIKFEV